MRRWLLLLAFAAGLTAARADGASLAPPPEPAVPAATHVPAIAKTPTPTPVPAVGQPSANSVPFRHDETDIPDSIGAITVRPVPEAEEAEPAFIKQVDYFKQHHDPSMAISYLEKVVVNPDLSAHDRSEAILVLSDSLAAAQQVGNALCWLKIWMQLYPARSEVGAVAYRMGALYTRMGLSDLARDSFYLALSNAVNHGQVQGAADLEQYTRLTVGTLWALALNEYKAGAWARAAELFDRYEHEAQSPSPGTRARGLFLQADCYYQLHDRDHATAAYTLALKEHPYYELAPEAHLRLYHLDLMAKKPDQAQAELEALVWEVRTVWPKDEAYWQQRTATLLLALNHDNLETLPPLLKKSAALGAQDKAWQADLGHYDRLASLIATIPDAMPSPSSSSPAGAVAPGLAEQDDLTAMSQSIDALAPPKISAGKNP
jgi:tetratricopeptide (TPR) repeat protein